MKKFVVSLLSLSLLFNSVSVFAANDEANITISAKNLTLENKQSLSEFFAESNLNSVNLNTLSLLTNVDEAVLLDENYFVKADSQNGKPISLRVRIKYYRGY